MPAVRLTQQIGPEKVADYARRLGLEGPIPPYLSITLGAAEATLLEMVSAYSAFANQGIDVDKVISVRSLESQNS